MSSVFEGKRRREGSVGIRDYSDFIENSQIYNIEPQNVASLTRYTKVAIAYVESLS